MPVVLLVEDEPAIRESLAFLLLRDGVTVREAGTLALAREVVSGADAVVLDLSLPDGSGLDFLRWIRGSSSVPVLILTSRDEEIDRVLGLELGADDYVVKPFSPREVLARLRAIWRRLTPALPPVPVVESPPPRFPSPEVPPPPTGLHADPLTREATLGERSLLLSKTEFDLLVVFLSAPFRVWDRDQLLAKVRGPEVILSERTIDVHLKALRRKIAQAGGDPAVIETVRGVGYRYRP